MHREDDLERRRRSLYQAGKKSANARTKVFTVVGCPKDNPNDEYPPFMPEGFGNGCRPAVFTYEGFMDSLKMRTWPSGMKVRLSARRVIWGADGKKVNEYRRWYYYIIPYGTTVGLYEKITRDVRQFDTLAQERLEK